MNKDLCENILGLIVIGKFKEGKEDYLSSFEVDDFYAVNNKKFQYVITNKKNETTTKRKDTRLIEYFSLFHTKYDPTEIEYIDDIASMNEFKNKTLTTGQVMIFINAVIKNEKIIVAYKDGVDGEIKISNFDKTEDFNENGIMEIIMNCVEHDMLYIIRETIKKEKPDKFKEIMDKVLTGNSEE